MSLTHFDERGNARMVDVSAKAETRRYAVAEGFVGMKRATLALVLDKKAPKGDPLAVAQTAGIMAAKKTPDLIPLCHTVNLTGVDLTLTPDEAAGGVRIVATARSGGKTGVEMEALTAVSVAALTVYDMLKAVDREMTIGGIVLTEKAGGKSGHFVRSQDRPEGATSS
jgi:cyclic pyranopterin phosphate synthase